MIRISQPDWHDDGIVECWAILSNATTSRTGLRSCRARLIDVRDALFTFCDQQTFHEYSDEVGYRCLVLLDCLAFLNEALSGPLVSMAFIVLARNRLNDLVYRPEPTPA